MTNKMIERVAQAIIDMSMTGGKSSERKPNEIELRCAKAAIAAMREPTEEMLEAAEDYYRSAYHTEIKAGYEAMIDAALKE